MISTELKYSKNSRPTIRATVLTSIASHAFWAYGLMGTDSIFYVRSMVNLTSFDFVGYLVIDIDKELLSNEMNAGDFGTESRQAIVNIQDGTVIAEPFDQETADSPVAIDELSSHIASVGQSEEDDGVSVGSFSFQTGMDDSTTVIYTRLSSDWFYMLQIPDSELLSEIRMVRMFGVAIAALISLASIFAGVSRSVYDYQDQSVISKPSFMKWKSGDLTVRSKFEGKYDLGQLSASFNHMIQSMNELVNDINNIKDTINRHSEELDRIASRLSRCI